MIQSWLLIKINNNTRYIIFLKIELYSYVKAGPWTPEVCVEHPEAVLQLHREFLRAGADVMQAFTFYASDDKLKNRGHIEVGDGDAPLTCKGINSAACDLARQV